MPLFGSFHSRMTSNRHYSLKKVGVQGHHATCICGQTPCRGLILNVVNICGKSHSKITVMDFITSSEISGLKTAVD